MSGAAIAEVPKKDNNWEALIDLGPGTRNLETYVVYNGEMAGILEDGDEVVCFSRPALAEGR